MYVVTDQTDRTGREDADRLGMKHVVGFLTCLSQFLLAAEDNLFVLHVGREAVGHELVMLVGRRAGLVAACEPGIEPAPDRAVSNIDDVTCRPKHHAFTAGITATSLRNDARRGANIRLNLIDGTVILRVIDDNLLCTVSARLWPDRL